MVSPLIIRSEQWEAVAASLWVFQRIRTGHRLQFAPFFAQETSYRVQEEPADVLQEEVVSLLKKGAIS